MGATIHVGSDQVDAARALIRIRGGEDMVDPVIVRIPHAEDPHSGRKYVKTRRSF